MSAEQLGRERRPYVRATVVGAQRPTSAKPGDSALVLADGTIDGFVGGQCAESTVRTEALAALAAGESVLLAISPHPTQSGVDETGRRTVHNPCLSGGTLEIFLEPVLPAPLLVVAGDAPIARALRALGEPAGFALAGWSPDAGLPADAAAVVVATHGRDEEALLTAALQAGVPYVGLVASRRRGTAVVDGLGLDDAQRARIRTPAGLDLGARRPAEVAVSILAEIIAARPQAPTAGAPSDGPAASASRDGGTASAVDPVCGMAVAAVAASLSAQHAGRTFWFCGTGCREAFLAAPERYDRA